MGGGGLLRHLQRVLTDFRNIVPYSTATNLICMHIYSNSYQTNKELYWVSRGKKRDNEMLLYNKICDTKKGRTHKAPGAVVKLALTSNTRVRIAYIYISGNTIKARNKD